MKSKFILISALIMLASCTENKKTESKSRVDRLPYYNEATFTPKWISEGDQSLDTFHRISPFQLINQDGEAISQKTFEGKIYIADFFFTSCSGICPKMTSNMGIVQAEFAKDDEILILSHSVTPEKDSVSVLKTYAEEKGVISNKWHLVTGPQKEIYKLGRRDYFIEEDLGLKKNLDDFLHTENFVLIDKKGHIRGLYNGLNKSSINQLIIDVKALKKESN